MKNNPPPLLSALFSGKNSHSHKSGGGFSLIEMLFYITVLVFMLLIVIEVTLSIARSDRVIKALRNVENSAILALERIGRETRGMESVNVAASTLGVHPGRLVLSGEDAGGNPRTVEFYLSGGRIILRENGVDTGALTGNNAVVTSLVFTRFATSTAEGIRTALTLESGTTTSYRTETFYASTLLR